MGSKKASRKSLGKIHKGILALLEQNPHGLSIYEIRELLPPEIGIQQHLDKRVRELRDHYEVPLVSEKGRNLYVLKGKRHDPVKDAGHVPSKLRAEILHMAHGRCLMCGRTVADDGIKLQIDHRVPRNWGGVTERDNLWAICDLCNSGKRDFFASFDDATMAKIVGRESVYERILETLRLNPGKPTPSWLLEFVANANDWQDDWQKRLRELRYPVIGIKIRSKRRKSETGKWESAYILTKDKSLPKDHKFLIKEFERQGKGAKAKKA